MGDTSRSGQQEQETEINCFSCSHFFITHDADFPYGCRAVGFKSRLMPSQEMLNHSDMECQFFTEKEKRSF